MPPTPATARRRPRWWTELLLIAVLYEAYSLSRLVVAGDADAALRNAERILRVESLGHLDPERVLNQVVTNHVFIGVVCDYAYATLHYAVTPLVLFWLWRRRPERYRGARTTLAIATVVSLAGFMLFPTAPPRMIDGFTDTMAHFASWGWWGDGASAPRGMEHMTNEYAAMPSLHVGWAAWCGWQVWRHGRAPLPRVLGVLYPLFVVVVVLGTANHYLADVVAGLVVMGLGALASPWVLRGVDRVRAGVAMRQAESKQPVRPIDLDQRNAA
ncbi:phosphatase PAP2 family protein [Embleya scabrispora]|uniref:phosphatase PAP2 family protein n=1 Tax=Embleya scabrispora TaxID=159449 RepID=UPI001319DF39|nr:phosphatase PAP2 family protein [Embleya scabrispora]MYS82386.1 PAP2 family protein [Streptomyces sp. SID5474]